MQCFTSTAQLSPYHVVLPALFRSAAERLPSILMVAES